MRIKALTREQVLGKETIKKDDLVAAVAQAKRDHETGQSVIVPDTYAEFRKALLK